MRDILRNYEAEARAIKTALERFAGLTLTEARSCGWTEREDKLQFRLWELGYKITDLRYLISKNLEQTVKKLADTL